MIAVEIGGNLTTVLITALTFVFVAFLFWEAGR